MMNIPKYIQKQAYIALSNDKITNQSQADFHNHQLIIKNDQTLFVYLDNYDANTLSILVKENVQVKVFLMTYNSRFIKMNFDVEIESHGILKLYSQFVSRRFTKLSLDRKFRIHGNGSLILLNHLTYRGSLVLNEDVFLQGEQANLDIDLLDVGGQDHHATINQHVHHHAKKTYSQIHNWLISNDNAKMAYYVNGSIAKGFEKSNCQQLNKGIILSEQGEIKVIPSLFIDEYDVQAGHGAAIGQIDENQLFYLKSRGMTETQAKNLIISGYINPFITKIKQKDLQAQIKRRITRLI